MEKKWQVCVVCNGKGEVPKITTKNEPLQMVTCSTCHGECGYWVPKKESKSCHKK